MGELSRLFMAVFFYLKSLERGHSNDHKGTNEDF